MVALVALVLAAFLGPAPAHAAAGGPPPLPAPTYASVAQQEVQIPMDDGVKIAGTLYFPSRDGKARAPGQFPVVLSMTPYGRTNPAFNSAAVGQIFAQRGIAFIEVDVRGTGGSGGTLADNYFSPREARDGGEIVQWLGTQPWSTGKVGMTGGSYVGITQYLTAEQQPSHLVAITPDVALADLYRDAYTHGGVLNLFFDVQYLAVQGGPGITGINTDPSLLIPTIGAKLGQQLPVFLAFDYLKRPGDDPFYRDRSPIYNYDKIQVPVLVQDGWRDGFVRGAVEMYHALAKRPNVLTRMTIGPCTHKGCGAPFAPFDNPPDVEPNIDETFEFLNHYLTGAPLAARPPVRVYVQGAANHYISSSTWPPTPSNDQRLYLAPKGIMGAAVPAQESVERYATNPAAGVSMALDEYGTIAITPYAPLDQRAEEANGLTWRTPSLKSPLTLAGPMVVHLVASSSATETDWYGKVADVAPGGSESIISEGVLRASHRQLDPNRSTPMTPYHTHTDPRPLTPGKTYDFDFEVWPTAYELAAGHRLQLRLTSSDLPTHLPGTIDFNAAVPSLSVIKPNPPAVNTVRYGCDDPSSLTFTALDAAGSAGSTATAATSPRATATPRANAETASRPARARAGLALPVGSPPDTPCTQPGSARTGPGGSKARSGHGARKAGGSRGGSRSSSGNGGSSGASAAGTTEPAGAGRLPFTGAELGAIVALGLALLGAGLALRRRHGPARPPPD